ncbi:LOW QUALITY PROTEIN: receptor protein kinase-like protein ZAR1 [Rhodamnia argentea]|uniref:LOW QUALITY PROTEIN: receptor protein kinase-like protein ZAR1 n=1 Tax=Rhodamnia argentea TaxID=178133 RepID=A0A8B8NA78_9MYRT|nr:LOW QUALITY PROTEIN: receptor protein kinase-like protein ZAR1 [Rhodamnia argentea]
MRFSTLPTSPLLFLLLLLLCFLSPPSSSALTPDGLSLLALKAAVASDPTRSLSSWSETDVSPCRWAGVACSRGRVASLFLAGRNLSGYIPSELGLLGSLKRLNLAGNNFSKPIPSRLFNATSLVSLDLSRNSLFGPIPTQIKDLRNLTHLDLSSNSLNGSLPEELAELRSLSGTLNLSYNGFSGDVPASYGQFPVMVSLDLGHNNLTGKIPQVGSLLNQGPTAFAGNPGLCGFPLSAPCPEAQDPRASSGTEEPREPENEPLSRLARNDGMHQKRSNSLVIPVLSGLSVIAGVVFASLWFVRRKRRRFGRDQTGKEKATVIVEEVAELEGQKGKFVVVDEGFDLELEDLLRASAYVVGKSRSGIVYKVVVGQGSGGGGSTGEAVAVRRLSEGDAGWRFKEFESEVEAISRVNHPNVVRLRAYYYASDEKLLVSDFIRNGCLYSALHGGPSKSSPPLSWASRLKIAQGTARGLTYIHEHSPRKYVHGNLKSTKILLDDEFQPYLSGFGLHRLISGTPGFAASSSKKHGSNNQTVLSSAMELKMPAPSVTYLAPEARVSGTKVTQKCDVYSFGIVLMEILTGRKPDVGTENDGKGLESLVRKVFREERPLSEIIDPDLLHEVHVKKQVVAAFHVALNCTELDPELRPRMRMVSESLDRIKVW